MIPEEDIPSTRLVLTVLEAFEDDAVKLILLEEFKILNQSYGHVGWRCQRLSGAFIWTTSPQGHGFWSNINRHIERYQRKRG